MLLDIANFLGYLPFGIWTAKLGSYANEESTLCFSLFSTLNPWIWVK